MIFLSVVFYGVALVAMQEKERERSYQQFIQKHHLFDCLDLPDTVTDKTLLTWIEEIRNTFRLTEQEISGELVGTNFVELQGLLCKGTRKEYLLTRIVHQEEILKTLTGPEYSVKLNEINIAKRLNSGCYKIHAMPGSVSEYYNMIKVIIYCLCNNSKFQESVNSFKMQPFIYFSLKLEELGELLEKKSATGGIIPIIVVYPGNGKDKAQYVLDVLYEQFMGMKGLGLVPRFSKKVTEALSYTLGNGDEKGEFCHFFTKNRVFYKKSFISTPGKAFFELKDPGLKE